MASHVGEVRQDNQEAVRSGNGRGEGVTLSPSEEREVEGKLPPSVQVLHEAVRIQGEMEMARSASALAWSSLAAGLSMGFSMLVPALLQARLPHAPAWQLVVAAGYTVGFLIVILARQQLFTENTTTAVLPLMTKPGLRPLLRLLRLWGIVLLGNIVGGAVFAFAVVHMPIIDTATAAALHGTATEMLRQAPWVLFSKGIVAGWLIATMVWLLAAADHSRALVIVLLTWLVGIGGFAHVVVGSIEALYLVFEDGTGGAGFVAFLLPTLAGNVVGGSVIFALISHAQVRSDEPG
ncbi:formate/nitrite transporter family protein [Luteimonas sp. 50]|uniref:Formate/nitrite transporter family protein n=1 Tax=Cognatiluteimonas sedimenti TaxID=2927791 RepID=A0ABT0A0P2_9GAMM|nr:formate/nitrite transporter family protein [Lysobacter sedimenti]MCJ0824537.1 formate/nitrite transporter family protein [Lysobacter sedimenti]